VTANPRAARRNQLFLWGLLPALVLLLLAGRVGLLLRADAAGRAAYATGEYGAAQGRFEANRSLNVLEPWKAPFNAGTALYRDEELAAAVDPFEAALDAGPGRDECTVRIDLALTHEAIGDAAAEADDEPASRDAWTLGREVLAAGDCPTDAGRGTEQTTVAEAVDARLADKLGDPPPEQQQEQEKKTDQQQDPEQQKKQKQIEERNQRAREGRQESKDLDDYPVEDWDEDYQW
jgi:hypothetical protein